MSGLSTKKLDRKIFTHNSACDRNVEHMRFEVIIVRTPHAESETETSNSHQIHNDKAMPNDNIWRIR